MNIKITLVQSSHSQSVKCCRSSTVPFAAVRLEVMIWGGAVACCVSSYFLAGWRNVAVAVLPPPLPYPFAAVAFGAARIATVKEKRNR